MKKFIIQTLLLLTVTFASLYIYTSNLEISNLPLAPSTPGQRTVKIKDAIFKVDVADTQAERAKGLSGRQTIASEEGMLFVFEKEDKYPFWMKGLTFALDFIWIRDKTVVDLLPDAEPPPSGQPDSAIPIYQPKEEVDKVLEVAAGTIKQLDIKVGDTVLIE